MPAVAEELRKIGIAVARTDEGFDLPVIDVTHPRFAIAEDAASAASLHAALVRHERRHRMVPGFLMRFMLKAAAKRSRLVNAMFGSGDSAFLDGMSTYVMKTGPDNLLAPYDTPTDRQFAASPHAIYMRLRTQQIAGLLAAGLVRELAGAGDRPLVLLNIAGGPAIDSMNALILMARNAPHLLRRRITIHVLDLDDAGPRFGNNSLLQLTAEGAPLCGLDIDFAHTSYDWNGTSALSAIVERLQHAVIVASSEGGLFEYGSDAAIVANLKALRADGAGARCIAGSVTRNDEARAKLIGASQFEIIPRGIGVFSPLAAEAGYAISDVRSTVWSDQVSLRLIVE